MRDFVFEYMQKRRKDRPVDAVMFQELWTIPWEAYAAAELSDLMVERVGMRGCSSPLIGSDMHSFDTMNAGLMTCYGGELYPSTMCMPSKISLSRLQSAYYPTVLDISSDSTGIQEAIQPGGVDIEKYGENVHFEYPWRAYQQAGYGRIRLYPVPFCWWLELVFFGIAGYLFLGFGRSSKAYLDAKAQVEGPEDIVEEDVGGVVVDVV